MKKILKEYINIISIILCMFLLCVGFYNIFINIMHQNFINDTVTVTSMNNNYTTYQDNLIKIKNNISNYSYQEGKYDYNLYTMNTLEKSLKICTQVMDNEHGLNSFKESSKLKPFDVYSLDSNFINEIINQCWIYGFSFINLKEHDYTGYFKEIFPKYDNMVSLLTNSSNYVRLELMNNSSYHYSTFITKNTIRDELSAEYELIAANYASFSNIILEISDYLVRGNVND